VQLPSQPGLRELNPLRVVVADDHELMREGIVAVVSRQPGFVVSGCAIDAGAAFALLARHRPDLLLIDVFLGGSDGTHLVNELATCYPETRILALCAFEEPTSTQRFLSAGATGFLVKSASSSQLVEALTAIALGKTYSNLRSRSSRETARAHGVDNGR
jgi:DNA-binding NarL/FixJ family response regulator